MIFLQTDRNVYSVKQIRLFLNIGCTLFPLLSVSNRADRDARHFHEKRILGKNMAKLELS